MRILLLALFVIPSVSCSLTKRNPALCCETDAECAAIGFDSPQPCDLGVCIGNRCEVQGCDGHEDCGDPMPYCVASTCVPCDSNGACDPSRPICDESTHECRQCTIDNECASGVCDASAGACVDETSIRFVSPGGTTLDACSRAAPCSLAHAFTLVDAVHPYIEMTPGMYTVGATLQANTVTLVADQATLHVSSAAGELAVRGQGTLRIRHLKVLTGSGATRGIGCTENSELDVFDIDVMGPGIQSSGCRLVKVNASTFTDGTVTFSDGGLVDVGLIIDRSRFFGQGPFVNNGAFYAIMTNSLVVVPSGYALRLLSLVNGAPTIETRIEHNTFVGGIIDCNDPSPSGRPRHFLGNIFLDQAVPLPKETYCDYDYNLVMPPDFTLGGVGNVVGDPRFVNAASGDYHLQLGSPAIDASDPASTIDHDLDNSPRPQGARSDIGAFEHAP